MQATEHTYIGSADGIGGEHIDGGESAGGGYISSPTDGGEAGAAGRRTPPETGRAEPMSYDDGEILCLRLGDYIAECRGETPPECGARGERRGTRIPNVAGFCRHIGRGLGYFYSLRESDPEVFGRICAVLEDEALNSGISASILSVYLKARLSGPYDTEAPESTSLDSGGLTLIFDHDIEADGE